MILPKLRQAGEEALRNIWRYRTRHLASLAVVILAFLCVGLFLALANNLRGRAAEYARDAAVVFYLRPGLPAAENDLVAQQVRSSPLVASARLVDAEESWTRFLARFPDLGPVVESLGRNPFPASVETALRDPAAPSAEVQSFIAEVRRNPAVEDAVFNREGADRIRALGRLAEAVGLVVGGLLILASVVIISGVVRLNVIARRDEVEILRLVGATNAYIRGPYLVEGAILGVLGSLTALALVALAGGLFPAAAGGALGPLGEIIGFRGLTAVQGGLLVASGAAAGLLGSASSLARLLKI
jgi:cell division transport system permease protein